MKRSVLTVAVFATLVGGCGFETVSTGHRGVKTHWNEVDMKAGSLPEGFYTYSPISEDIVEMDTRIQKWEGKTNTYTKDVQQADVSFVLNYRLRQDQAHIVYKDIGWNWDKILVPQAVEGELKKVIGQYDAVDLIAHRGKATIQAQNAIADSLREKGVEVSRFEMVNIQYDKQFEKAVEDKVVAIQMAVGEQNRTKQVEEKAKQTVLNAKADSEAMRIKANALQQNAKLVEYEAVQKWDGKLPQYTFGNSVPFIDLRNK